MLFQWDTVMLTFLMLSLAPDGLHCKPAAADTKRKRSRYTHSTYASSFFDLASDSLLEPISRNAKRNELPKSNSARPVTVTKAEYLKPDWCKTEPLKQIIREKGCLKRKIMNRFCYGQCNSFFIPRMEESDPESAFVSCAFCKPRRWSWMTITLRCPGKRPRFQRKRIQRVRKCRCMPQELT